MTHDRYDNPLISRYSSPEMAGLWSEQRKFGLWRRLWVILAEAEREMGLPIKEEQIQELAAHVDDIDFKRAAAYEQKLRHDVMAHVHTYGDACPNARPIIHLGATSCYVTDNADLVLMREGLVLLARRIAVVIDQLGKFAKEHRDLACLAFTHLQPAQPTTVGRRACLWAYDLALDLAEVEYRIGALRARSVKGTTGTQASFLALFHGDHAKVRKLDRLIAEKLGFGESYAVTGQTYSRKVDSQVLDVLSGIAQSAHKMATDVRILAHRKEIEEPFERDQIGSSAMAYKRNPMRCERMGSLARFVLSLQASPGATLSGQWLERTLDDSANRRLVIPESFLATDAILILMENIARGLEVHPARIRRRLKDELPFMATEELIVRAVRAGGDRQVAHESIRKHSIEAARAMKNGATRNDMLERLSADPDFGVSFADMESTLDPMRFVGRAPEQVDEFLNDVVAPLLAAHARDEGADEVRV